MSARGAWPLPRSLAVRGRSDFARVVGDEPRHLGCGIPLRQRIRRLRGREITEAVISMHHRCEWTGPSDERLASSHEHRHTIYLAKLKQRACVAGCGRHRAIPEYRGHGVDLERSEAESKQDAWASSTPGSVSMMTRCNSSLTPCCQHLSAQKRS